MRSPLHIVTKESSTLIYKVLVLSILHKMVMDLEMQAFTSHVISAKDIIYPRLTSRNTSGWCLANLAYDGGLA
jgi:hypothetical protein